MWTPFLSLSLSLFRESASRRLARSLVSATLFTILGNVCKVITIGINVAIWDKHATPFGIACLMFCLVAAYFYEQAPLRADAAIAIADLPK